jgi:hypothetical protein
VNRCGINLFWYSFWNSQKNYAENVWQTFLFKNLLTVYLKNGLNTKNNPYWHSFFWKKRTFNSLQQYYFRKEVFTDPENLLSIRYRFRAKFEMFYKATYVFLRYANWIIILIQSYTPLIKSTSKLKIFNQKSSKNDFGVRVSNFSWTKRNLILFKLF